uniref:Uncharacterized protein n=1 Tax=Rhizophora mucronata TaxID=61149 RepID=A0A2P2QSP0_RHIMU
MLPHISLHFSHGSAFYIKFYLLVSIFCWSTSHFCINSMDFDCLIIVSEDCPFSFASFVKDHCYQKRTVV